MRFLIFTTDCPPLPGLPTSGTALRTFGIAKGLEANGHEVIISPPLSAMRAIKADVPDSVKLIIEELKLNAFDSSNQKEIVNKFNPDVIVCGHWPALSLNTKPSQIVVLDLAGPHMLERHYQKSPNQHGALLAKLTNLAQADFYIVSGEKQKYYFLSYLMRAAVENPETRIIKIPMALSPEMPKLNIKSVDPKFIFAGVFLPWQDPSAGLKQLVSEIEKRQKGSLKLIGGTHPNYNIKGGVYQNLFEELSKSSYVITKPMLPYDKFVEEISDGSVALDLMAWNLERELAVTIRTTTFLWSGLPVIYNNYSDLSALIKSYDAGWTVEPGKEGDSQELADAIDEIYSNPSLVEQKARNAQRLSAENFLWTDSVKPLLNLVNGAEQYKIKEIDIVADYGNADDIKISKQQPLTQFFTCRVPGLSRIEFKLNNSNNKVRASLYNLKEGTHNWNKENSKILINKELESNSEWFCFDFNPIKNSAGEVYALSIESEQEIAPATSRGSYYPLMGLFAEGKTIPHMSLCFKTQCTRN